MKKDKLVEACFDCYRELYKEATPSADFDELVENATIAKDGRKVIDYNAYTLDRNKYQEIVEKHEKKVPVRYRKGFHFEMWLGCGPKTV